MNQARIRQLNSATYASGDVAYWMIRDQRAIDNWALNFARNLADENEVSLTVVFCLRKDLTSHLGTARMLDFMLKGLEEVEEVLSRKQIPFYFLIGEPEKEVTQFIKKNKIGAIVTDFSPLANQINWKKTVGENVDIPFYEVDTHNIVPCWKASSKQEFGAYTFRSKLMKLLPEFLDEFPFIKKQEKVWKNVVEKVNWKKIRQVIKVDESIQPVNGLSSGTKAGYQVMKDFFEKIEDYERKRNDPNQDNTSQLSSYFHFGQISSHRVALEANKLRRSKAVSAFLEEMIVRKELSDNFCFYNENYKTFNGFPSWAKKTLDAHRSDKRDYIYSRDQFERSRTHDELWNAAQNQMVKVGKMHGYMRMYWAKKILEWTKTPEEALKIAIYLNDKYEIDGRDPNGYVGIAWSIGGVHDRAWFERPIYGKVRYMNANGAKRKFDTEGYIKKWN